MKKLICALTAAAFLAAVALPATSVGAHATAQSEGPTATAAGEMVKVLGRRRLPARRKFTYRIYCAVDCNMTVRTKLLLPGRDIGPLLLSGSIPAGYSRRILITLNRAAVRKLRRSIRSARLRVVARATDPATGAQETAIRRFRFKRV